MRSRPGDTHLADMYTPISRCGPSMAILECMVMEKLSQSQILDIVNTVTAADKVIPLYCFVRRDKKNQLVGKSLHLFLNKINNCSFKFEGTDYFTLNQR
jgi:hypothetical protein